MKGGWTRAEVEDVILCEGRRKLKMFEGERFRDRILGNIHAAMDAAIEQHEWHWDMQSCRLLTAVVDELEENADKWACLLSQKPLEE